MPQYVLKLTHTPDRCPVSNSKTRERLIEGESEMPNLAAKLGIKIVAGPLALVTEHESIAIVESDRVEAVQEFIIQSGLVQWNCARISPAVPLQEAMKSWEKMPPPLY
jgi:hypothetical protein